MDIAPTTSCLAILLALGVGGCDAADRELEPEELDVRDLLGLAPSVAAGWDADARAAARDRLMEAWAESRDDRMIEGAGWPESATQDEGAIAALGVVDARLAEAGRAPVIGGVGQLAGGRLRVRIASPQDLDLDLDRAGGSDASGAAARFEPVGWRPDEAELIARGQAWAIDLAAVAGHPQGAPLRVRATRQVPFGAVYLGEELGVLVNPVLLASLEPAAPADVARAEAMRSSSEAPVDGAKTRSLPVAADGNPYSFYGSVAECAAAERLRCEACLPSSTCVQTSRDAPDGNSECETLGSGEGLGYHLYCVNLSLAIATVAECTRDEAPGCAQDNQASNRLERLENNRVFLDDAACGGELDGCLAEIYGEPESGFPPPPPDAGPAPDGGTPPPPPPPPREVEITCGEADCDFSPQCDSSCSGSCDQVLACDADCNGGGDGCSGDGGNGGGGGGNGGGCDSGGSDGSSGGGGCDGCGSESGSGSGRDCGGSDCGGSSDCGGGDCGGGDCGGDCSNCNSGGGSSCAVARRRSGGVRDAARACPRRAGNADALVALVWVLVPLPYLERCRRRARRRQLARPNRDVPR